jgi:hypothetical protein
MFGGKIRRKETTRRSKRRWEDEIKMDIRETGWKDVEWIHIVQYRD